jgi:AraC family ethanolamine operon transcriptional activator
MQIPQALSLREVEVSTGDPGALSSLQPERRRDFVQLERGRFEAVLREQSGFGFALLYECWSCGVRVRCARPRSYVAFAEITSESPARWCATEIPPGSVLEVGHDWEMTTRGALEYIAFMVERESLEAVEGSLAGGRETCLRDANRLLPADSSPTPAALLRARIKSAFAVGALPPETWRVLEDDLTYLAARLRSWGASEESKPESESRRRLAVRRVEEYLDAHASEVPSIAALCAIAGVSERTLEYAFQEQIGVSPIRYLRLRRLNAVRLELLRSEAGAIRVTDAAMRWGFWELGRFAREYRALFGELPSETLAGRRAMKAEPPR